jgi:hypothetical protein
MGALGAGEGNRTSMTSVEGCDCHVSLQGNPPSAGSAGTPPR